MLNILHQIEGLNGGNLPSEVFNFRMIHAPIFLRNGEVCASDNQQEKFLETLGEFFDRKIVIRRPKGNTGFYVVVDRNAAEPNYVWIGFNGSGQGSALQLQVPHALESVIIGNDLPGSFLIRLGTNMNLKSLTTYVFRLDGFESFAQWMDAAQPLINRINRMNHKALGPMGGATV